MSPYGQAGIGLKLTSGFFQNKQGSLIDAQLVIDAADLTFTGERDGRKKAVMRTTLMTLNEKGVAENQVGQDYTFQLKAEPLADVQKYGLLYRVQHPLQKPGAYLMRAVIVDRASGRFGTATQMVDVPDVKSSGLVLANFTVGRQKHGPGTESAAERSLAPGDTLEYRRADDQRHGEPEVAFEARMALVLRGRFDWRRGVGGV